MIDNKKNTFKEAKKDCFRFMKNCNNIDKYLWKEVIYRLSFFQKEIAETYCYTQKECSKCSYLDTCILSSLVSQTPMRI